MRDKGQIPTSLKGETMHEGQERKKGDKSKDDGERGTAGRNMMLKKKVEKRETRSKMIRKRKEERIREGK